MTCIAAIRTEDSVWLTGDSAGVGGLSIVTRSDKKVFVKKDIVGNEFGFGFTSSFRMGQLIQYHLSIPPIPESTDLHEYMVSSFIPALRACLKDGGFTTIKDHQESGGTFLVAVNGRLFYIDDDFQVGENIPMYASVGCGVDLALGALYATKDLMMEPEVRLNIALAAAQEFSAGVRAPFNTVVVRKRK